jgi:hypothetical protein
MKLPTFNTTRQYVVVITRTGTRHTHSVLFYKNKDDAEAYKTQLLADKALTNLDIAVSIIEIDMSCYDSQDGWIFPVQYGIEATFKPAANFIAI